MTRRSPMQPWTLQTIEERSTPYGECLLWNNATNSAGHPTASILGKNWLVRRFVYLNLMGKTVRPNERVVPRCGEALCVSHHCLISKSLKSFMKDSFAKLMENGCELKKRQAQAKRNGFAKLDMETAILIRSRGLTRAQVMQEYGLSDNAAGALVKGRSWRSPKVVNSVWQLAEMA